MCTISNLNDCEKRIFILKKDESLLVSDWFRDENEKSSYSNTTLQEQKVISEMKEKYNLSDNDISEWTIHHNKEKDNLYISTHAYERMHERNRWNKSTAERMVKRAYEKGIRESECHGAVKEYIQKKNAETDDPATYIVYGENLFVIKNNILITMFHVPKPDIKKKKEKKERNWHFEIQEGLL